MADDDILEFDFEGVEPAVWGNFVKMPKGEYNLQCASCEKFYAKTSKTDKTPDPNKPGLHFKFVVTMHPTFAGTEIEFWQMLGKDNRKFLLNTLMCLIPEVNWQQNSIKVPLSQLIQKVSGRPCNGMIDWEINNYEGKRYVNNKLQGLKPFDQGITQPVPTEGNPPILTNDAPSQIAQQASSGVSKEEVNEFLNDWPGGTGTPAPAAAKSEDNFFSDPF